MAVGDNDGDGVIPDVVVDRNGAIQNNGQSETVNEFGLSGDEAKAFADMQTADVRPAADDAGTADADAGGEARARNTGDVIDTAAGDPPARQPGEVDDDFELPPENAQQQTVSYGKHRRELKGADDRRKAAVKRAATAESENTVLRTRMEMILEALQKRQPAQQEPDPAAAAAEADPRPDPDDKPFEYAQWVERQVIAERAARVALEARIAKGETSHAQETEDTQVANAYLMDARTFAGEVGQKFGHPQMFSAAYEYLKGSRYRELCLTTFFKPLVVEGKYNVSQEEFDKIEQRFRDEEKYIATQSIKQKARPAAFIWAFALERGFKPEEAKKLLDKAGAGPTNGKGLKTEEPAPSVTDAVKELASRVESSVSLSDGGSAPVGQKLTVNRVASMGEKEFAALLDGMDKDQYETALLGR